MTESKIKVAVIDHTSGKRANLLLSADRARRTGGYSPRQAVGAEHGRSGRPQIHYGLILNTPEGSKQVKEDETMAAAGVSDGSELRLTPEMTAGSLEVRDALL